ncbi:hypothetical protein B0H14DRAFT_2568279 [Mycena olivaceomarginata]|nr:hypothetical protein B0H14DRAFT_2568279 [Mycena olivaceomarginata]
MFSPKSSPLEGLWGSTESFFGEISTSVPTSAEGEIKWFETTRSEGAITLPRQCPKDHPDWQKLVTWQDFHDLSLAESSAFTPNVRTALWNIGNLKGQTPMDKGPEAYISIAYEGDSSDGYYSIRSEPVNLDGPQKLEVMFDLDENQLTLGSLVTKFGPSRCWTNGARRPTPTLTSDVVLDAYRGYYNRLAEIEEESAIVACMQKLETYVVARKACEAASNHFFTSIDNFEQDAIQTLWIQTYGHWMGWWTAQAYLLRSHSPDRFQAHEECIYPLLESWVAERASELGQPWEWGSGNDLISTSPPS